MVNVQISAQTDVNPDISPTLSWLQYFARSNLM